MTFRPLFERNLRHHWRLLAALTVGLTILELLLLWVAAKVEIGTGVRNFIEMLAPPQARAAIMAQIGLISFPGAVAFGFQHPVSLVAAIAFVAVAATIPAGEREAGFLDLVLARAVDRDSYLVASLGVAIVGAVVLPCALLLGAAIGLSLVDVNGALPWWRYVPAAAGMATLLLAIGGWASFFATGARRRGLAVSRIVGVCLALYVLDFLADQWAALDRLRWLSPFHYFKPVTAAVIPHTPLVNPLVLLALFVAGAALALLRFRRQDL